MKLNHLKYSQNNVNIDDDENLRIIEDKEYTEFPITLLNKLSRQNFYVPLLVGLSQIHFPASYDVYFVTTTLSIIQKIIYVILLI